MSPDAAPDDWKRLGEQLTIRRVELDLRYQNRTVFSTERGIDYRLAYDIEEHRRSNFRSTTLAGTAAAYGVTLDSMYAVLRDPNARLEPLTPAGASRLAAVPDLVTPDARLSALDRIVALYANATPAEAEKLDAMADAMMAVIVEGDEVAEGLWRFPDPKGPSGKLLPRDTRLAFIRAWLADDPRRALDDEGRRGTA